MNDLEKLSKPPVKPVYFQQAPNEEIDLGNVTVNYECGGTRYDDIARVKMTFLPRDNLVFTLPLSDKPADFGFRLFSSDDRLFRLTLPDKGVTFDAICAAAGSDYGGAIFNPSISPLLVTPAHDELSCARLHLFNFPVFRGPDSYILLTGDPPYQGQALCSRSILKANGWTITIAGTDRTSDLEKELKQRGGYVITHMVEIKRDDASTFTSSELKDIQNQLHYFLSFALGRWVGLALPVGYDASGNCVFESWGLGRTAINGWGGSTSCFDAHHGEFLSEVFPGFIQLWNNPVWQPALPHALYWYLSACSSGHGVGLDVGLILAQTALESLAWTYCVQDRKLVLSDAFKPRGLSASNKLRLLASSLNIPLTIPDSLSSLRNKTNPAWKDGMDAITGIRNSLVHSDGTASIPHDSYYDAWRLSLWYLDMVFLRLFGHQGNYANRLSSRWAGQVERVPWAK